MRYSCFGTSRNRHYSCFTDASIDFASKNKRGFKQAITKEEADKRAFLTQLVSSNLKRA